MESKSEPDAAGGQKGGEGLLGGVMDAVRIHIRENGLQVGDWLPSEGAFAEKLGVSRGIVREAYRSLSALTLIDIGNGRRPRVDAPRADVLALVTDHAVHTDQVTIQQIFDVRRTVERRTVVLAAMRRTDREAAAIVALAEAMQRDFDAPQKVMEHDIAFHEAIGAASRNPMFSLIVGSFHVVTRQTWPIGWASRASNETRQESIDGHMTIARAIANGDPTTGEQAMVEHFDLTVKALLAAGVY
ncbi:MULTISPECIES: FadR/GntR family transcriptional regulator [unclassified Shinella]|uniref:FadR/GntR family transcriptional regulator n=1 Tax=unclassified Shinella TaxID=2643062 RepID=UPI00225C9C03|nr:MULTISPECIES: FadR/GntR family transcriptional regulator [unclassified Shinella]MCO5137967.1 FadR family transcriptional regulator [Shinella sp.]MDC7258084.1 FadR family transcriptional regulator [Shinella sp. YE25]CAI0335162.1 GntR family transcriptional regulator [Rhizobiaceae bacterium]CAK7259472.1 GntR family transcriptional regulator, transcriptional repressor for pyruvate dehydrogenase complex [Shinella sp. WSC3-e]